MSRRHWLTSIALLTLAACDRAATTGDEIASELRALRLALREVPRQQAQDRPVAREAIDGALLPLREVLVQLGNSQRELAIRQTSLTQEMQRWTQLVVGSLQEQQGEQGRDLLLRLQQLEQSMSAQDARHREVETLLQSALNSTADHLEDFLRRLDKVAPPSASPPPNASVPEPSAASDPAANGGGGMAAERTDPPGDPPLNPRAVPPMEPSRGEAMEGRSAGAPGDSARRSASSWPWWVLALGSVALGMHLLLPRRRPPPLAVAPEMRAVSMPRPPTTANPLSTGVAGSEVEELWAAAALLGEAIGKLKQSGNPADVERLLGEAIGAELQPPQHEHRTSHGVVSELDLDVDDVFVIDDEEELSASEGLPDVASESPATPLVEPLLEPIVEPPLDPALTRAAAAFAAAVQPTPAAGGLLAGHTPLSRPEAITCRLPVTDSPRAEQAVRQLLVADPRVMVQPAPEVRPANGELCICYSLLPGLPAGERSQLEQRLRDAVA